MTALGGGVEENFKAQDLFRPLQDKFGHRVVYEAASNVNAKLASVMNGRKLNWGPVRSKNLVTILHKLPMIKFGDNDKAWWIPSRIGSFIVAFAWDQQDYPKVEWWKVIWFPNAIPRLAFIS